MFKIRFMIALLLHTSGRAQSPHAMLVATLRLSKSRIIPGLSVYIKAFPEQFPVQNESQLSA